MTERPDRICFLLLAMGVAACTAATESPEAGENSVSLALVGDESRVCGSEGTAVTIEGRIVDVPTTATGLARVPLEISFDDGFSRDVSIDLELRAIESAGIHSALMRTIRSVDAGFSAQVDLDFYRFLRTSSALVEVRATAVSADGEILDRRVLTRVAVAIDNTIVRIEDASDASPAFLSQIVIVRDATVEELQVHEGGEQ